MTAIISEDLVKRRNSMSLKLHLAANVITLRKARKMTYAELSEASGLSKSSLWEVEHAKGNPTVATIEALSEAFGVSAARLVRN